MLFNELHDPDADGARIEYDRSTPDINKDAKRQWWYLIKCGHLRVRVLTGISFKGNVESMIGCGTIFATPYFKDRGNLPRFDFVTVRLDNSEALAQVLNFIEITDGGNVRLIYAYVAWLEIENPTDQKDINYGRGYARSFFPRFKYEPLTNNNRGRFNCNISLIESSTIMGPAYVVPDFKEFDPTSSKPSSRHRYFYVMRQWTDRSDWVESFTTDSSLPNVVSSGDAMERYIKEMSTSRFDNLVDDKKGRNNNKINKRRRGSLVGNIYDIDLEISEGSSSDDDDEE
jgi:hypothetical protein